MRGWKRRLATGVAAVGLVGLAPVPAEAHPKLLAEEPPAGAVVQEAPGQLLYRYDEDLQRVPALRVTGPDGDPVETEPPAVTGGLVEQPLPRLGVPGLYVVVRTVQGADGDVVTERSEFTVAAAPGPGTAAAATPTPGEPGPGANAGAGGRQAEAGERSRDAGGPPVHPLLVVFLGLASLGLVVVAVTGAVGAATARLRGRADQ